MRKLIFVIILVIIPLILVNCTNRNILRVSDNQARPVMTLETYKISNYLLYINHEHEFWNCEDKGETIICTRACGGNTDLVCPKGTVTMNSVTTNVR